MKNKVAKRILSAVLAGTMMLSCLAGCGKSADNGDASQETNTQTEAPADTTQQDDAQAEQPQENTGDVAASTGKTIMWLSNLSSGIAYDCGVNYAEAICAELGYEFKVVYGDMFNDPAGNLAAVKNEMSDDVVAIIASQDGGILNIMQEYPELYVCGYNTDMRSVYAEDGPNKDCLSNEKFLGTIVDGHADGSLTGKEQAAAVIEQGYKKVSLLMFPAYAYPNLTAAEAAFRAEIEAYNATAADADKIEIVGDTKVLEFAPLEESYFLEPAHQDLDAIVGFCAGIMFVYPSMKAAIGAGTCSADTKLVTGGFDDDSSIIADVGGDGVIQYISFSPAEDMAFPIILIDNALNGTMYSDYPQGTAETQVDPIPYVIDSKEDIDNVMTKSMAGTADVSLAQLSIDEVKNLCTRFNPEATYADLVGTFTSEQISVEELKNR